MSRDGPDSGEQDLVSVLKTPRLDVVVLSREQLAWYLLDPERLEATLALPVSQAILTPRLRRAIIMKLEKMARTPVRDHPWYTYWLMVIKAASFGAGLAGFKGIPDETGTVEIGYGIDPGWRDRGYATEAARSLLSWAFSYPACLAVVAPNTPKSNKASNRVLQKLGMFVYEETSESLSWRVTREQFHR